jgi:hypothetical protein
MGGAGRTHAAVSVSALANLHQCLISCGPGFWGVGAQKRAEQREKIRSASSTQAPPCGKGCAACIPIFRRCRAAHIPAHRHLSRTTDRQAHAMTSPLSCCSTETPRCPRPADVPDTSGRGERGEVMAIRPDDCGRGFRLRGHRCPLGTTIPGGMRPSGAAVV